MARPVGALTWAQPVASGPATPVVEPTAAAEAPASGAHGNAAAVQRPAGGIRLRSLR